MQSVTPSGCFSAFGTWKCKTTGQIGVFKPNVEELGATKPAGDADGGQSSGTKTGRDEGGGADLGEDEGYGADHDGRGGPRIRSIGIQNFQMVNFFLGSLKYRFIAHN